MNISINPSRETWPELLRRPLLDVTDLHEQVGSILRDIRTRGDSALREYTLRFDRVQVDRWQISAQELDEAEQGLSQGLKDAIQIATENIRKFHKVQIPEARKIETTPGVFCWQKAVPIGSVGLYIPGGTAPLFSTVLMLAVPAKLAGCAEIVLCTPPRKDGTVDPAILYAAKLAGVTQVYRLGGVQAIGAMAYGVVTPRVDKIFGPGNQYVMAAKQMVSFNDVAIDMPAGPSEVAVVADENAHPAFIAADLLSQAEHGPDSQVVLVLKGEGILKKVQEEIDNQMQRLPRREVAKKALENSRIIIAGDDDYIIDLINWYAPEHLIINTLNYTAISARIQNAGSVFLGKYTPESAGDYASGTNHTLPTNGWARSYSGLNMDSFMKKITFQEITAAGLKNLGPAVELMAEAESLEAHRNAVTVRLKTISF